MKNLGERFLIKACCPLELADEEKVKLSLRVLSYVVLDLHSSWDSLA